MELLIGFIVFDVIVYLLLKLFVPGPEERKAKDSVETAEAVKHEGRERSGNPYASARLGHTFPSQQFAQRGILNHRIPWPRRPVRQQDLPPRW